MNFKYIVGVLFTLIINFSSGQNCNTKYYNASSDSTYYNEVFNLINDITIKCKIPNISWDDECNSPRKLRYLFTIKVNCQGKIDTAYINYSKFEYTNKKGETIIISPYDSNNSFFEEFFKKNILELKYLKPMLINNEPQNTEIKSVIAFEL